MPRPAETNKVTHTVPPVVKGVTHPSGDTITIYSDNAVYDETQGKFIHPEDLKRS